MYRRSKVVLNHATDVGQPFGFGYGYQCRHFEVGMTATPLLSNCVYENNLHIKAPLFASFSNMDNMIEKLGSFIEGKGEISGEQVYSDMMMKHLPQHRAMQLINYIERNA